MGLFSSPHHKNIAVVDIASGSIGGGLVAVPKQGTPTMVSSTRVPFKTTGERLVSLVRACDELSFILTHQNKTLKQISGDGTISEVWVTIGAPWQKSKLSTKVLEDKKPFVISRDVLNKIVNGTEEPDTISAVTILSSLLNGYQVKTPLGKSVSRAEFSLLSSALPKDSHNKIANAVKKIAPKVVFVDRTQLFWKTLGTLCPREESYLVLSVTEEESTIVLVRNRIPRGLGTVPFGTASFTRAARSGGVSIPTEKSLVDMTRNSKLEASIQKVEQTWLAALTNELKTVSAGEALPRSIFLFAPHESRDYLKRVLEKPALQTLWMSGASMTVVPIISASFAKRLVGEQTTELDVMLGALALSVK